MSTISASTTSTTAYKVTADTTGALVLQTGATPTTAMTIDTSQNVGIGTSSPNYIVDVKSTGTFVNNTATSTSGFNGFRIANTGTSGRAWQLSLGGSATGSSYAGNFYIFDETASTQRLVIDTSGNVGIGTSSPGTYGGLVVQAASGIGSPLTLLTTDAGANAQVVFKGSRQYQIGTGNASSGFAGSLFFYDGTAGAERMRIDSSGNFLFNSGYGSVATAYGCRAWVNFNGTGTVAIRASGNVSSITDNGTGDYTVNFTNAMPDANYSAVGSSRQLTASGYLSVPTDVGTGGTNLTRTTSAYQIQCVNVVGGLNDNPWLSIAIFR